MAGFTAFYDANVLYPAELRNLHMHLALIGLFRAKWSADVHEEWISSLLKKRPDLTRDKLERTRMLMDQHAVDALVTGYEDLIPGLQLPDPDDRHVLAAAIRGHADVIITMNLRDFPSDTIGSFGMRAANCGESCSKLSGNCPWARRYRSNAQATMASCTTVSARAVLLIALPVAGASMANMAV